MLASSLKPIAYSLIALAALAIATAGVLGSGRDASAFQSAPDTDECDGIPGAATLLTEAASLDDVSPFEPEQVEAILETLERAAALEADGKTRLARTLEARLLRRLALMVEEAGESENITLAELMKAAAAALGECVDGPSPGPRPDDRPADDSAAPALVYSTSFACVSKVHRRKMAKPGFGEQIDLVEREESGTGISIHNFTGRPVAFWLRASLANGRDRFSGATRSRVRRSLAPYQAMHIECPAIRRMLASVDHEVCEGKLEARAILERLLDAVMDARQAETTTEASSVDRDAVETLEKLIAALDKAITLEEDGKLRQAMRLERDIAHRLEKLASVAEEHGREHIAEALSEASTMVLRCAKSLAAALDVGGHDDRTDRPSGARGNVRGFVAVETPRQLEVTATYETRIRAETFGGHVAVDADYEVVQIRPHRIARAAGGSEL